MKIMTLYFIGNTDAVVGAGLKEIGVPLVSVCGDKDIFIVRLVKDHGNVGGGTDHVDMPLDKLPLTKLGMLFRYHTRRVTRWELVVVQKPDLHSPLLRLGKDNIHIPPPGLTNEVGMRS